MFGNCTVQNSRTNWGYCARSSGTQLKQEQTATDSVFSISDKVPGALVPCLSSNCHNTDEAVDCVVTAMAHLLANLDEGLLHLHGIEAVQRVGHAHTRLIAALPPRNVPQPVHTPSFVTVAQLMQMRRHLQNALTRLFLADGLLTVIRT